MNQRGAGVSFCIIAAMLYATKYISAAIFGSGVSSWDQDLFGAMLSYVGNTLTIFSVLALCIGVFYLIRAEREG